jgi:hypothetical protein
MPLLDTGISITAVRNESQQGNRNYISGLTTSSLVNPYSFWSPRGTYFDPGNGYLLTLQTDQSPYQIGDFRRYNHAAVAPSIAATPNTDYALDPGSDGTFVPAYYNNNEFNFKRADSSSEIVKVGLRYFTTLTDAQNNTNPVQLVGGSFTVFENLSFTNRTIRVDPTLGNLTPSPALTGHVVTQTTLPSSSSLLINTNTTKFPSTGLTTSPVTRYVRLDFYDTANNIKGKLADNIFSFTIRMKAEPTLAFQTQSPIPSGFTAVFVDTYVTSDNTQAMSIGDNVLRARIRVKGIQGMTNDFVSGTLSMKYWDGTTETVMTGYQNVAFSKSDGTSYSLAVTWTMPSGRTWSYDSNHTVRVTYHTASF